MKLKKSEPRKFWNFLNGNKKSSSEVTAENCFEYFKTMNSFGDHENVQEINFETNADNLQTDNEDLNGPILWSEIEKAVFFFLNNKSGGLDIILNEHIKNCYKVPTMKDILLNLLIASLIQE